VDVSLEQIARALNGKIRNGQVIAPGPNHSHLDESLSVTLSDTADDGFTVHSFAGDDWRACKDYVLERLGLPKFEPRGHRHFEKTTKPQPKHVATYDYTDESGKLLYQVCRYKPKDFRQRRPNGKGWIWSVGKRRVVYRWPELLQFPDATIFVTEGEKDADSVAALGLCATTVAAGKWTEECILALRRRDVIILQDNDDAGRDKALKAAHLLNYLVKDLRVVLLPGLPEHGDVSDWLDMGHTKDELERVCLDAPSWEMGMEPWRPQAETKDTTEPASKDSSSPLCFVNIADWCQHDPPPRDWAVRDRFPLRNVSLLSGEGSAGKTILLMQLAAAHVLGRGWLDTLPEIGPAIFLNAEDEESELHRRFVAIANLYSVSLAELKDDLHILALAGQDAVLGYADHSGLVKPTKLFQQLTDAAREIQPKFIGLDTSADIFAGNENDRTQVRQFVGLLRGLAIAGNSAVIVCAHPSLTGINSGTGLSGSTAWHNSVRARAYLRPLIADDIEPDKTLRQLDFMKSNYSAIANSITLRWKHGVFVPEPKPGSLEKMAADAKADDTFLQLLKRFNEQGRHVSAALTSINYAPTVFAEESNGISRSQLADAMRRLFQAEKIRVENYGRPSRPYSRIAIK
jgi:RecA-family ATPase